MVNRLSMDIQKIIKESESELAVCRAQYKTVTEQLNKLCVDLQIDPSNIDINKIQERIVAGQATCESLSRQIVEAYEQYQTVSGRCDKTASTIR